MPLEPLDALERCTGAALGPRRGARPAVTREVRAPRRVLEDLLLPALRASPCLVAFSGGRDSSALLASAVALARRDGLPDPVPVTFRYAAHPRTDETGWQEALTRRLGLRAWEILPYAREADALGAGARSVLERHGSYWPAGAHVVLPLLAAARGGALVTGAGGDELFSPWEHRRLSLIRQRRLRPGRRDVRALVAHGTPPRLRQAIAARRGAVPELPWLTEAGAKAHRRRSAAEKEAYRRPTWALAAEVYLEGRYWQLTRATLDTLAADADVRLVEPLYDPAFVRAVVRHAPAQGYASRRAGLEAVFGDVLPPETLARTSKAVFTDVWWGPETRAFVDSWRGDGVDERGVDVGALRAEWRKPRPHFSSIVPLHAAWLDCRKDRAIPSVEGPRASHASP